MGGYYDAGDNVKYGLPLAFTVTTLAWAGIHYRQELQAAGEMDNLRLAVRWGTDYLLKASNKRNRLYVQVITIATLSIHLPFRITTRLNKWKNVCDSR